MYDSISVGKILQAIKRIGGDIRSMVINPDSQTEHVVKHTLKDRMIVPYVAITNNLELFLTKGDHYVMTADGYHCKIAYCEEKHICELEDEIQKIYGIDAWSFVRKWHRSAPQMDSMHFLVLDLKKVE